MNGATVKECQEPDCHKAHLASGWCSMHYSRVRNHGSPNPPSRGKPIEQRLWPRVDKAGDSGCWIWTGALNAAGYGAIGLDNKVLRVHRVVYKLLVGPIPDGLQLDHLCRNRACCNPAHLEPVTNRTNWLRGQHPSARSFIDNRCSRGHSFTPENTATRPNGTRYCRTCARAAELRRRAA